MLKQSVRRPVRTSPQRAPVEQILSNNKTSVFWLAASRLQPAVAALVITYTISRTQTGATASALIVGSAIVPLLALGELGRVTRWSSALSRPAHARAIQREVIRSLVPWHAAYLTICTGILCFGQTVGPELRLELTSIGIVGCALTVASMLAVYERTLVMMRRYRALTLCAVPSTTIAAALFAGGLARPSAVKPWLIVTVLSASILAPKLLASIAETRRRYSGVLTTDADRVDGTQANGSGRAFFTLQVLAILSFNSDILLARAVGQRGDAVRLALVNRAFGPVLLVGSLLAADIWPRLAHEGDAPSPIARRLCLRVLGAAVAVSLACIGLSVLANHLLPEMSRLRPGETAAAAIWHPMLAFGSAIGQALAARNMADQLIRLGWMMCAANLALSLWLGRTLGVPGFLLGSLISYTGIVLVPTYRMLTSGPFHRRPIQ